MSETYVCPGCAAHDMVEDCYHSASAWELAEAMRDGVEHLHPGAQWTPLEGAWGFVDDAEAVIDVVGKGPFAVSSTHPSNAIYDTISLINGRWLIGATDDVADYIGDMSAFPVATLAQPEAQGENEIVDWFKSGSSARIRRILDAGEKVITERVDDGVFE